MLRIVTRLRTDLAVATVAAVAMYIPALGLPLLGSCLSTGSVVVAAPSPTCASDLRECLRQSARTGIYGARYVTAEDVAKCVEAFNACIHGSGQVNPNPPTSTSTAGGGNKNGLPTHFAIRDDYGFVSDCRVNGEAVACTQSWETPPDWVESFSGTVTGTLSGLTVTGTQKLHQSGQIEGCSIDETYSGPITFVFNLDGSVKATAGPAQRQSTFSCADPTSGTTNGGESDGTWSPVE